MSGGSSKSGKSGSYEEVRLNAKAADITGSEPLQDQAPYWESDHAGAVGSFELDHCRAIDAMITCD